jgi:hypothetical protein
MPFSHMHKHNYFLGLHIKSSKDYKELAGEFRAFFCRRCYTYNCDLHGIVQPLPRERRDEPPPPFLLSQMPFFSRLQLPTDNIR